VDAIHRARQVVGDQQAAVRCHEHICGASPGSLALQPALGERLLLRDIAGGVETAE
jgi:hypothetical protein